MTIAKCKKCKSDDYEIIHIENYEYEGDCISMLAKVRCCECGNEFYVKEFFDFSSSERV